MDGKNEKKLFEAGCFLPEWTLDDKQDEISEQPVFTIQRKDMQTLLDELEQIKEHIRNIQERQWLLAKLLHFHENNFARE